MWYALAGVLDLEVIRLARRSLIAGRRPRCALHHCRDGLLDRDMPNGRIRSGSGRTDTRSDGSRERAAAVFSDGTIHSVYRADVSAVMRGRQAEAARNHERLMSAATGRSSPPPPTRPWPTWRATRASASRPCTAATPAGTRSSPRPGSQACARSRSRRASPWTGRGCSRGARSSAS